MANVGRLPAPGLFSGHRRPANTPRACQPPRCPLTATVSWRSRSGAPSLPSHRSVWIGASRTPTAVTPRPSRSPNPASTRTAPAVTAWKSSRVPSRWSCADCRATPEPMHPSWHPFGVATVAMAPSPCAHRLGARADITLFSAVEDIREGEDRIVMGSRAYRGSTGRVAASSGDALRRGRLNVGQRPIGVVTRRKDGDPAIAIEQVRANPLKDGTLDRVFAQRRVRRLESAAHSCKPGHFSWPPDDRKAPPLSRVRVTGPAARWTGWGHCGIFRSSHVTDPVSTFPDARLPVRHTQSGTDARPVRLQFGDNAIGVLRSLSVGRSGLRAGDGQPAQEGARSAG